MHCPFLDLRIAEQTTAVAQLIYLQIKNPSSA